MKILNLIANKLFYFTCSFLDENGYIKNPILSIDIHLTTKYTVSL